MKEERWAMPTLQGPMTSIRIFRRPNGVRKTACLTMSHFVSLETPPRFGIDRARLANHNPARHALPELRRLRRHPDRVSGPFLDRKGPRSPERAQAVGADRDLRPR